MGQTITWMMTPSNKVCGPYIPIVVIYHNNPLLFLYMANILVPYYGNLIDWIYNVSLNYRGYLSSFCAITLSAWPEIISSLYYHSLSFWFVVWVMRIGAVHRKCHNQDNSEYLYSTVIEKNSHWHEHWWQRRPKVKDKKVYNTAALHIPFGSPWWGFFNYNSCMNSFEYEVIGPVIFTDCPPTFLLW